MVERRSDLVGSGALRPGPRAELATAIGRLGLFVAIPGVSADPGHATDVARSAAWVAQRLRIIGFDWVRTEPDGSGGSFAHTVIGGLGCERDRPTVLVYGHHDVQPADPRRGWRDDPFRLSIHDGVMFGRGVSDDKGQVLAWLDAIAAWVRRGHRLPVNLRVVVDGAEEIGSPGLAWLLSRFRRELGSDLAVVSDNVRAPDGRPAIVYGQRGAMSVRLRVSRPGGTPHAGRYGGLVGDAAAALARVVAGLDARRGWLTPGVTGGGEILADGPVPVMRSGASNATYSRLAGAPIRLAEGRSSYTRTTACPAFTVTGLRAGDGSASIPASAAADLDIRLAAGQRPTDIAQNLSARATALAPRGFEVDVAIRSAVGPTSTPTDSPAIMAAATALQRGFGVAPVMLRSGGTMPVIGVLRETLGLETVVMGFGDPDDHAHAAAERMRVTTFARARLAAAAFLAELGAEAGLNAQTVCS